MIGRINIILILITVFGAGIYAVHDKEQGNDIVVNIGQANGAPESVDESKVKDIGGAKTSKPKVSKKQTMCSAKHETIFIDRAMVKSFLEAGATMGPCPAESTSTSVQISKREPEESSESSVAPVIPKAKKKVKNVPNKTRQPRRKARRVVVCLPAIMKAISIPAKSLNDFVQKGAVLGNCTGVKPSTAPPTAKATTLPTAPPTLFPATTPGQQSAQPVVEIVRVPALDDCDTPTPPSIYGGSVLSSPYGGVVSSSPQPLPVQRQPANVFPGGPANTVSAPKTVTGQDVISAAVRPAVPRIPTP
jgi:hypothetical protein